MDNQRIKSYDYLIQVGQHYAQGAIYRWLQYRFLFFLALPTFVALLILPSNSFGVE